jgi:hypothetical protein
VQLSFVLNDVEQSNDVLVAEFVEVVDLPVNIIEFIVFDLIYFCVGFYCEPFVRLFIDSQRHHRETSLAEM